MANPIKGSVGEILFSFDGGTTYTAMGGVKSISFDYADDEIMTTDFDSNNFKERIAGDREASFSVDANYEEGDDVQDDLLAEMVDTNLAHVRIRPQVGTGKLQYTMQVLLDASGFVLPENDASSFTISGKSTGAITRSTQS